jgi:hypothetical protein
VCISICCLLIEFPSLITSEIVRIRNLADLSFAPIATLHGIHKKTISAMKFSPCPNSNLFVTASFDSTIQCFSTVDWKKIETLNACMWLTLNCGIIIDPDAFIIVACSFFVECLFLIHSWFDSVLGFFKWWPILRYWLYAILNASFFFFLLTRVLNFRP